MISRIIVLKNQFMNNYVIQNNNLGKTFSTSAFDNSQEKSDKNSNVKLHKILNENSNFVSNDNFQVIETLYNKNFKNLNDLKKVELNHSLGKLYPSDEILVIYKSYLKNNDVISKEYTSKKLNNNYKVDEFICTLPHYKVFKKDQVNSFNDILRYLDSNHKKPDSHEILGIYSNNVKLPKNVVQEKYKNYDIFLL